MKLIWKLSRVLPVSPLSASRASRPAACGPRDQLDRRLIPSAFVIPIVWIILTLLRGAVIDAYPYGFIYVVHLGYAMAIVNVLVIVLIGIAICFLLIGVDRIARRWST